LESYRVALPGIDPEGDPEADDPFPLGQPGSEE
jgi:hypothetical protein